MSSDHLHTCEHGIVKGYCQLCGPDTLESLRAANLALRSALDQSEADCRALRGEVERLRRDCAEAYQVCGYIILGDDGSPYTQDDASRVLDNLSHAAAGLSRPHDDLLPWPKDRTATEPQGKQP